MKKVLTLVSIIAAVLLFGCTPAEQDLGGQESQEENKEKMVENNNEENTPEETIENPSEQGDENGEDPNPGENGENPGEDPGEDPGENGEDPNNGEDGDNSNNDGNTTDSEDPTQEGIDLESYLSAFYFEYKDTPFQTQYLVPVAINAISKEEVLETVNGQGWKTTALYLINMQKEVVYEYALVTGSTLSSANHETYPNYLIFSSDGQSVTFYKLRPDGQGLYETDPFTYEASDNAITLPTWYGSWGGNGRLVYLSSEIMACVCTHGTNYKGEEIIYLEILGRVPASERQSWIDLCPHYGIRV